jgi:predicted transcriptional regulator
MPYLGVDASLFTTEILIVLDYEALQKREVQVCAFVVCIGGFKVDDDCVNRAR